VDSSAALRVPGVVRYFGAKDVPGDNMIGPIMHDEEVFATDKVTCVGQVRAGLLIMFMSLRLGIRMKEVTSLIATRQSKPRHKTPPKQQPRIFQAEGIFCPLSDAQDLCLYVW
jgi:hypothetical protein